MGKQILMIWIDKKLKLIKWRNPKEKLKKEKDQRKY